ncbi:hypothetical protein HJG60_012228 [Phyllostomus discolor]|uniref:Uncharacterized protein n=1 Tax=Phyllostomus discolor TaxID=89673 RepID=A0A834DRK3_9CHIR|nr:hypothetical protein HJG60_012228 [Phyllostomus discolor]
MSSRLDTCFSLGDTIGLENSHQVWTQKENQQFTKEVELTRTDGILQSPAVVGAYPPPEDVRPASEDRISSGPTAMPQTHLCHSGCPQAPVSLGNQMVFLQGMSDSSGKDLEENISSYSLEKTIMSTCEVLEDPAKVISPDRTQDAHRTTGEPSNRPPASLAGATLLLGTCPKVALGEDPLADLPGAPASPEDTSDPEDTGLVGPLQTGRSMAPGPQKEVASGQTTSSSRNGPIKLQFELSDDVPSKRPPPPRKLGKRPVDMQEKVPNEVDQGLVPPPQGSYNLDWDKRWGGVISRMPPRAGW